MTFSTPWVGQKRVAFVPVLRRRPPEAAPVDWGRAILRRVYLDPQPLAGNADYSLRAWLRAVSSGRADIEATVLPMQTLDGPHVDVLALDAALGDALHAEGFDAAVLVLVSGAVGSNAGFWSRVSMENTNGVWLMEIIHGLTNFKDLYHFDNDVDPADRSIDTFDQMAGAAQTHPTTFTKHELGWLDVDSIAVHGEASGDYALQHVSLGQPLVGGRVAAVRVGTAVPYLMIESRRRTDQFERGYTNGVTQVGGIQSEGVIVYRVQTRNPTVQEREGHRKPLLLMTQQALQSGESVVLANGVKVSVTSVDATASLIRFEIEGLWAPRALGAPRALSRYDAFTSLVVYRDTIGHLHELWRDLRGRGTGDLTAASGAPRAAGNPFVYFDPAGDQVVVLFRSSEGHVRSLYGRAGGGTGHDDLTAAIGAPRAAGDPVGWYSSHDQYQHVAYRGVDGHLHELWWKEHGDAGHSDLTALAQGASAGGDPWPYYDTARSTNIVTFRSTDGRICSFYWTDGGVGQDDLSGTAGTPRAASDPCAWYSAIDDTHHILYRSLDGHVHELYSQGQQTVRGRDLTALSGAPRATGNVSGGENPKDNTRKAIVRAEDGSLHEIWFVIGEQGVRHTNLTAQHGAWLATEQPSYFATRRRPYQHVSYRSVDGQIHELQW